MPAQMAMAPKRKPIIPPCRGPIGNEYVGFGTHEQYFYPEYFVYQPEYEAKFDIACKKLYDNGYEFVFIEDAVEKS